MKRDDAAEFDSFWFSLIFFSRNAWISFGKFEKSLKTKYVFSPLERMDSKVFSFSI
ncbi:hypothetical protein LEP1GSC052_3572 [Leptospira kmetyi serovar Malaysia str. Bejo-Iso9]|nr:hypothetical protein LEP1GSC052_3572 [Leptospira kmetyi serovar Malaysia str. Bejo-Iso9]